MMRDHDDVRRSLWAGVNGVYRMSPIWLPMPVQREQHDMPIGMFLLLLITMLTGAGLGLAGLAMVDRLLSPGFA